MATRFCTNCGQPIEGETKFCTNCGAPVPPPAQPNPEPTPKPDPQQYTAPQQQQVQSQPAMTKPKSYLALAILSTVLCCLPLGVVSIIKAAKVDNLWSAGQYNEAMDCSKKAKNWAIIAAVVGIVGSLIYGILVAVGVVASYGLE